MAIVLVAILARSHLHGKNTGGLGTSNIRFNIVADHEDLPDRQTEAPKGKIEERGGRLSHEMRLNGGCIFQAGHEGTKVEG